MAKLQSVGRQMLAKRPARLAVPFNPDESVFLVPQEMNQRATWHDRRDRSLVTRTLAKIEISGGNDLLPFARRPVVVLASFPAFAVRFLLEANRAGLLGRRRRRC